MPGRGKFQENSRRTNVPRFATGEDGGHRGRGIRRSEQGGQREGGAAGVGKGRRDRVVRRIVDLPPPPLLDPTRGGPRSLFVLAPGLLKALKHHQEDDRLKTRGLCVTTRHDHTQDSTNIFFGGKYILVFRVLTRYTLRSAKYFRALVHKCW